MVSAHGLSAIVVTASTDKMGLMYTYIVLLLLGGFRSRVGYVTGIKSVIQQDTPFPYFFDYTNCNSTKQFVTEHKSMFEVRTAIR
jgi:hypothetical protein